MINVKIDSNSFFKDFENLVQYSIGFTEGIEGGQKEMMKNIGFTTVEMLKDYVDSNARVTPELLHHVYEWYHTGSPEARLFDVQPIPTREKISFVYEFRQSQSIKNGSSVPFYDKAQLMEEGRQVVIKPRNAQALAFTVDGEEVFTNQPVTVKKVGGNTAGQFERTLESFFNQYFAQSFMSVSGIRSYLENPKAFVSDLKSLRSAGKSSGYKSGYRWISKAGGII